MRRSRKVNLSLIPAVALMFTLSACNSVGDESQEFDRICVDKNNIRVEDCKCEEEAKKQHDSGIQPFYVWYFLTRGGMNPIHNYPLGTRVSGGSYSAPKISSPSHGTSRGGFGFSSHSGSSGS